MSDLGFSKLPPSEYERSCRRHAAYLTRKQAKFLSQFLKDIAAAGAEDIVFRSFTKPRFDYNTEGELVQVGGWTDINLSAKTKFKHADKVNDLFIAFHKEALRMGLVSYSEEYGFPKFCGTDFLRGNINRLLHCAHIIADVLDENPRVYENEEIMPGFNKMLEEERNETA